MNNKYTEYNAEVFKIAGFAFIAPLGRFFLEPIALIEECRIYIVLYVIISIVLAFAGIVFIIRGSYLLDKGENKWIKKP